VCPHPSRPYQRGDDKLAAAAAPAAASSASDIKRRNFEARIYKYYQRRIIVSSARGGQYQYAIILNHDSIGEWRGCIDDSDSASCDAAAELFDFIVYDAIGGGGTTTSNNWIVSRRSHKEEMIGDVCAHISNLKRGVFSFSVPLPSLQYSSDAAVGAAMAVQCDDKDGTCDDPRYVGFHEQTDPQTYKFKTVQINPDMEMASSKIRGRICANDTDKVANINPMLTSLLRLKMDDDGKIAEIIKDKLDSTCVLAELLLRYYDTESVDMHRHELLMQSQAPKKHRKSYGDELPPVPLRWYLAPFEMQILVRVMQWLKDRRQKQLKSRI
jgi:hypothetical protein